MYASKAPSPEVLLARPFLHHGSFTNSLATVRLMRCVQNTFWVLLEGCLELIVVQIVKEGHCDCEGFAGALLHCGGTESHLFEEADNVAT